MLGGLQSPLSQIESIKISLIQLSPCSMFFSSKWVSSYPLPFLSERFFNIWFWHLRSCIPINECFCDYSNMYVDILTKRFMLRSFFHIFIVGWKVCSSLFDAFIESLKNFNRCCYREGSSNVMCYPEFSWCWIHYIYGRGKHTLPLKSQIFLERKGNIFLTLWIMLVRGHDRKSKTYRMRDRCVATQLLVLAIDWNEAMN